MTLPTHGREPDAVIEDLLERRADDVRWQDGRTFGLVYDGGPTVHAVAEQAQRMFMHDNALNTQAFPSLAGIQREVCTSMAELLHGNEAAGFMTSGGTESILMAVKAARERGRAERGIDNSDDGDTPHRPRRGNIVLATSAHAAFHKGAHYFGLEVRSVDVDAHWKADPNAMADVVDDHTVLVVGSAPQYPQGVIDPIEDLAAIAADAGANFHTDACMGGFVLPFMEMLGHEVAPWDFRVPGVTSVSLDVHKLGYAPKGASIILHRTKALRSYQTFVFDDWLGGFYASPGMQGTRSAAPMASAWAVMQHLGVDGYMRLTEIALETARRIISGVRAIDGLDVVGEPEAHLAAICAAPGSDLDIFAVGDALSARHWHLDRQHRPDSLHATVSAANAPTAEAFLADLAASVAEVAGSTSADRSTSYATLE